MDLHSENTTSTFTVTLKDEINLTGNGWEVALRELTYPYNVYTLPPGEWIRYVHVMDRNGRIVNLGSRLPIQEGIYKSVHELLTHMRKVIEAGWETAKEIAVGHFGIGQTPLISIDYNETTNKVTVKTRVFRFLIRLSPLLADLLGLSVLVTPDWDMLAEQWTGDNVDLKRGKHTLYVYCSLACDMYVGDKKAPLLRTLALRGSRDSLTCETIVEPNYVGVKTLTFRTIEVNLRTETGEPVPFTSGHSIVTLHFRRNAFA
jgi:hypothetical protein